MQQVITITASGGLSGLQRKPGQGLNLQAFGHAKTERVSEILWDEDVQAWTVVPITGPFAGRVLTTMEWVRFLPKTLPEGGRVLDIDMYEAVEHPIYFDDYDLAVKAEVQFLDAARLKGVF